MKKFREVPNILSPKRRGKPFLVESGDNTWDGKDGAKRQQIIEEIGLEYKQINLLASVVFEIVKSEPTFFDNPVIADAIAKFTRIEEIRNG